MVTCPECEADIDISETDVDPGDTVSCESCGTEFEVTGLAPLELEPLSDDEDEEDEEDEEEDEEDDDELGDDDDDLGDDEEDDDEEDWEE
jgi:lysine biosynthesis protein LysW